MKRLLLIASLSAFCSAAVAQTTPGLPPEQSPAGEPTKFKKPSSQAATPAATTPTPASATDTPPVDKKNMTKAQRKAARKEKREEKVGPKPLD